MTDAPAMAGSGTRSSAVSGRRGDGVSGAGARLADRYVGRRLTLEWERLALSQFSRGPKTETSRTHVKKPERRQYLKNASHMLLTRARQGMVIFVPPGANRDRTRNPDFYDYLTGMRVAEV